MSGAASVGRDARLRLFCALTLPETVLDRIVEWQSGLPAEHYGLRIVPRDNLHVTLAFLGARPAEELEAIAGELQEAATAAGPVRLRPRRYRTTRSAGMLVFEDIGAAATELAADVHERLRRLGVYEPERRKWLPHVTVARFREKSRLELEPPTLDAFSPSGAAVYLSRLRPTGAEYVVVQKFGLGPA
jgi:RNA 2',3'-cyclic 3'-phosphodiesterase